MSEKEIKYDEELDTRGLFCPEPLLELREFSETIEIGHCFKVLADDPAADADFRKWAKKTGTEIVDFKQVDNDLIFYFRKREE
ncbi:MAG: sulfurtransferase TusA family protein [Promethearchaeota archaeon]